MYIWVVELFHPGNDQNLGTYVYTANDVDGLFDKVFDQVYGEGWECPTIKIISQQPYDHKTFFALKKYHYDKRMEDK